MTGFPNFFNNQDYMMVSSDSGTVFGDLDGYAIYGYQLQESEYCYNNQDTCTLDLSGFSVPNGEYTLFCGGGDSSGDSPWELKVNNIAIASGGCSDETVVWQYCSVATGDVNGDGGWNVLDIVALSFCILQDNCDEHENACAGDTNGDGGWNVLDIVVLSYCILQDNCGGRLNGNSSLDTPRAYALPPGITQGEQDAVLQEIVSGNKTVEQIVNILKPIERKLRVTGSNSSSRQRGGRALQHTHPHRGHSTATLRGGGRVNTNSRFSGRTQSNPKGKSKK
tara:strand:- start:531 stop:1370 length:840 start_codon:yes stop_codon:yes gene_type:complete